MYNLTNVTDVANDVYQIVDATNAVSNGLLIGLAIPMLFFIFLIVFWKKDFKKVLLADSFFMVIISGICWAAGFVGWTYCIMPVLIFGGSLIAFMFID